VDTNILSVQHYRGSDPVALQERSTTVDWWRRERSFFKLVASRAVERELAAGDYPGQERALAAVRRLLFLPSAPSVGDVFRSLIAAGVVPTTAETDALHLAFATAHRVDYLLSWNRVHLVSEETQGRLARFRATLGWRTPIVVSPDTIPKATMGEDIRRRD
jgi:predicted nucleic acid-binding protein